MKAKFIALLLLPLLACNQSTDNTKQASTDTVKIKTKFEDKQFPPVVKASDLKSTTMVPTMQNNLVDGKNVIYATAFLYAWDEVKKLLKDPISIKEDKQSDMYLVNASKSHTATLKPDEYSSSATYMDDAIVAEGYFKKLLPFEYPMSKRNGPLPFVGKHVQSFGIDYADDSNIKAQVKILYYKSDDDFVIKITPKDTAHEILLALSPEYDNSFDGIYKTIKGKISKGKKDLGTKDNSWKYSFNDGDFLTIPSIAFNVSINYNNLEGHDFYSGGDTHSLHTAYQRTAFLLDEEGAIVESYGYAAADSAGAEVVKILPKHMIFNKPFVLYLKRKDAANPYFAVKIINSELLVPYKK